MSSTLKKNIFSSLSMTLLKVISGKPISGRYRNGRKYVDVRSSGEGEYVVCREERTPAGHRNEFTCGETIDIARDLNDLKNEKGRSLLGLICGYSMEMANDPSKNSREYVDVEDVLNMIDLRGFMAISAQLISDNPDRLCVKRGYLRQFSQALRCLNLSFQRVEKDCYSLSEGVLRAVYACDGFNYGASITFDSYDEPMETDDKRALKRILQVSHGINDGRGSNPILRFYDLEAAFQTSEFH